MAEAEVAAPKTADVDMADFLSTLKADLLAAIDERLPAPKPNCLRLGEVAAQLGLTERAVREMVNAKPPVLRSLKVGPMNGARVVEQAEVDRYVEEQRRAG